jgi:DNA-binding NtrC family response regulator
MRHALIVEDDPEAAASLAGLVAAEGFTVATAQSLGEARGELARRHPDVILLDLVLPDGSGLALAEEARGIDADVVLVTGHASLETSIQALRLGAADYLVKPVNFAHLRGILSRVTPPTALASEVDALRRTLDAAGRFGPLWGRSAAMRSVYDQIARVAGTSVTVLVFGESGTGKELVAQTIHDLSRRRRKPFLAVNCGAIARELMESELFGHDRGSFTGAARQHEGYFERAHGGTLFLDEITEMAPEMQVKLLRVLESGTFTRVGGSEVIECDVRIVAATNRPPRDAVASGRLREDLFYRLNVFGIELPPLRAREADAVLLADHFLAEIGAAEGVPRTLTAAAHAAIAAHPWPGNVRELRNAILRAYVMSDGSAIEADRLPLDHSAPAAPQSFITVRAGTPLADVERRHILATLALFGGQKEKTAEALGISAKTLYNRLREYGRQG